MTVGAPRSSAIFRASAGVLAKPWPDTGIPAFATICLDSNSKNRMGRATLAAGWCLRSGPCCDHSSSPCSRLRSPLRRPRRPSSTSRSRPRAATFSASPTTVTGKITGPYGAPLVGRTVVLEARPLPVQEPPVQGGRDRQERARRPLRPRARLRPQPAGARLRARVPRRPQLRPPGLRLPPLRAELRPRPAQRHPAGPDLPDAEGHQAHRPDAVLRREEGQEAHPAGRQGRDQAGPRQGQEGQEGQDQEGPLPRHRGRAHPARLEGPLPLRELLPVQRGHGQPEAGLPEEEYKFS